MTNSLDKSKAKVTFTPGNVAGFASIFSIASLYSRVILFLRGKMNCEPVRKDYQLDEFE